MTTITREQAQKIIDAADEVITALAGTNEDVHPESDNMLRLWDDLNDRYAPPEVVRELARIALASLESEPVAYIFKHPAGELFWSLTDESNKGQNDVMPVYTAPPARDNKQTDELVMWVKRLAHSLRNARPNSKLHDAAMDYLSRKGLISVEDVLR
ncbi:hypothetical protein IRP70_001039 [Salmonella enterica]|nr:hypothetical protein [Salmonella enterica]EAS4793471.1 hypothetical protein [Salmonella enterica]EBL2668834.1 hypothetical protein [Salmonella enterica]EBL8971382.1 hypothetical protein [Salmonella enterica]ECO4369501.1 hypothetical protein [Salmonella enterica]